MATARHLFSPALDRLSAYRARHFHFTRPRLGLSVKLIFIVTLVSLGGILVSSLWLVSWSRTQLIAGAQQAVDQLAAPIKVSVQHAMLTHDQTMLNQIVYAIVQEPGLRRIRVLDNAGRIQSSSDRTEVGVAISPANAECQVCHVNAELPVYSKTSALVETATSQYLVDVSPIQNAPECRECHTAQVKNLGILMIEAPLKDLNTQLRESSQQIFSVALLTFGLIVGTMIPILRKYITTPVAELSRSMAQIGAENLDSPVREGSQDEIGDLAAGLEIMRQKLRATRAEMEQRNHESSTLYDLGAQISASLDLDHVLKAVAIGARQVLSTDIALVGLVENNRSELRICATTGTYSQEWNGMRFPLPRNHDALLVPFNRVFDFEDVPHDLPPSLTEWIAQERIRALLALPLRRGEHLVGAVAVAMRQPQMFGREQVRLLMRLGQQVIIAIENARLYQQVRYLAVLEERDRLAREMHDNLAQELGYLDLKTTITRDLLARGELKQVDASLVELKHVTRNAYTDTREAIFSLRTMTSLGNDFATMLGEYLAEYRAHYGLDARVIIEDETLTQFPSEASVQIHRIIQEALTNVRKHAHSTQARVRFTRAGEFVRITIEDNGRGFDPNELNMGDGPQRFGFQIMRERAESIGGTLEFLSQVNQGTQVVLQVPHVATQVGER